MSTLRVIGKFKKILTKKQQTNIIWLLFLMIFGGFMEMLSVTLIIPFIGLVMEPDDSMKSSVVQFVCKLFGIIDAKDFLILVALSLAFIYFAKNAFLWFEYVIQYKFVYNCMFLVQKRLFHNFIIKPYEFFLEIDSGELIRIISNDTREAFNLLSKLLNIFTEVIVSVILIGTVFFIAPFETLLISILLILVLLLTNYVIKPKLNEQGRKFQKSSAGMNKWLLQATQGIKEVKVMNREKYFEKNFDENGSDYVHSIEKSAIWRTIPRFLIEAVCMGAMFIAIAFMIYRGNRIEELIPVVSSLAMAAVRLLPSVNRISNGLAEISYTEPMLDKTIQSLEVYAVDSGNLDLSNGNKREFKKLDDGIEIKLENIGFHYPHIEKKVLTNAELTIRKGECVGIVGSSGGGKTTTVDIILGLLKPQDGHVLINIMDSINRKGDDISRIGYIPQSIFMLDASILENIAFGISWNEIDREKAVMAAREACLSEFINELANGIDTQIGERGVRLSGGQRQRIGIARALYFNPSILIFDEATSALDKDTEEEIMRSIDELKGKRTMIIIAHRLSTIENCDSVYRIQDGKIEKHSLNRGSNE